MIQDLLHNRSAETFKGSIHLAMFGLASVCAAYNIGAYCVRPDRRLLGNGAVYLALTALEAVQTRRHWRDA